MTYSKGTYAVMMSELQEVLNAMQSGLLDVDEMITKYEQGKKLVTDLEEYLKEAKNSVVIHHKAGATPKAE